MILIWSKQATRKLKKTVLHNKQRKHFEKRKAKVFNRPGLSRIKNWRNQTKDQGALSQWWSFLDNNLQSSFRGRWIETWPKNTRQWGSMRFRSIHLRGKHPTHFHCAKLLTLVKVIKTVYDVLYEKGYDSETFRDFWAGGWTKLKQTMSILIKQFDGNELYSKSDSSQ